IPGQVDLDVLDSIEVGDDRADVLLNHRPGRTAHRRQRVDHLDLRPGDLDVVEEPKLDNVHPELRVLDEVECFDDLFSRWHSVSLRTPAPSRRHALGRRPRRWRLRARRWRQSRSTWRYPR